MPTRTLRFMVSERAGDVSAVLERPPGASCLFVFAHGAGAGMHHTFMASMSTRLARRGVATLRFQFPYMEQGKRRPDHRKRLTNTVREAIAAARRSTRGLPIFAGGKSMGGRMTTLAAADEPLESVRGLVFFGFPLHPAGKPGIERAAHLPDIDLPMLFLQGDRDALCNLALLDQALRPVERPTVHVLTGADHGFHVLKRSGRTDDDVMDELASTAAAWCHACLD